ncbi:hypothetical protein CRYUN_Cryun25bG0098800 [Craigia yunnanensis]
MEKQRWGLRRLVLVPCPFQGHINPMFQLGTLLHANGFSITVAHTKFNFPNPDNHPDFTFLPIRDTLFDRDDASMDITDVISCLNISCKAPLQKSLTQIIESEEEDHNNKLPCIVYDGSMYFAEAVAHELELPSIMVRTTSSATLLTYYSFPQLQKEGYIPWQDAMSLALVPGLYPLRFKDLPIANFKNLDTLLQLIARTTDIRSSSAVICNTIECLERSSLEQLRQQCNVPVFPIGPLHTIVPTASSSLLKEDRGCIEWLDKQIHNSVLYVSLGSIASMNENELREMAKGLTNSRQPFLWVLRPGSLLPKDFNEIIGERGLIVKWAPQKEVLAHKAIGGFWSHCGWNSTLESICAGVAMICQPCFGDQRVNARFVTHVWKVGLEMDNSLVSIEIEKAIRRLMQDEEGHELRRRESRLKNNFNFLARNLNSLDIRLFHFQFWNSHSKHPIFHGSPDQIHLGILRQPEPPHELPTATFYAMPSVVLVFLLHVPLSAYLKHPVIFNLHFHFFFLKPWNISLEHVQTPPALENLGSHSLELTVSALQIRQRFCKAFSPTCPKRMCQSREVSDSSSFLLWETAALPITVSPSRKYRFPFIEPFIAKNAPRTTFRTPF